MSSINAGGRSITDGLIFQLDGDLSVSFVKTPKQLSGCILWLDAADVSTLTTEGAGYVRYWSDKSASGVVATGGGLTLANEPLLISNSLNGLSSIYFDGNDYFEIPNNSALQTQNEKTIFVVYKYTKVSNTNYGALIQRGISDGTEEIRLAVVNNADWIYFDIGAGGGPYIQPTGQTANIRDYAANIVTATATRSAGSSTLKLYSNGKDMGGSTIGPTLTPSVGSFVTSIGKQIENPSNNNFFTGFISEIIIYNRCLSDTERKQVEQYLGSKWAIPLSLTTSVTTLRDLTRVTTLNTIYPTTYPILQHPYKDAIEQNAYSDYITFNSNDTIRNLGCNQFTIEWAGAIIARINSGTNYVIFDNGESYQVKGVVIRFDGASKRLYVRISRGGTPTYTDFYDTTTLVTGKYYHYVITYDGNIVRFYLNGSLTNAVAFAKGTSSTDSIFYPTGTTQNFQGEILLYKIFNRALTSAEASYEYELEKSRIESMPQIVPDNLHFWLDANYHSSYPNTGTVWYDLSNNAKNFTTYVNQIVTAISFNSNEPRYFTFNGTSNWASSAGVSLGTSATVSVWIKMTSTAQCGILGDCLQDRSFTGYDISNGKMRYWYEYNYPSTQTVTGTTSVNTGTWKHLTWVKTGTSLVMYIDGVQDFSATLLINVTGFVNSIGTLWGPCNASPYYTSLFNGQMANIMCYSVALSSTQVLQNYNAQKYRFGK